MKAFQANDDMVEYIVGHYADMLLRIAFQNTRNYSDAEDVVQDVLTRFFSLPVKLNDENHLKAWLIRATICRCRDLTRSPWRKRNIEMPPDYPSSYTDEEKNVLEDILQLPVKYRNVIYLYYYEGYRINEIAEILSANANTVGSQLQRGRMMLKDLLEGEEP